jgi:acyl-CoA synthetase (AMP-forming)/AMP-acid ligase II
MFTSGTTGHPKGVMCTHGQSVRAFRAWSEVVGLRAGDRYLVVVPFFNSFGYKAGWLACLLTGATVLPQPVFDVDAVLARIGPDRVNVLPGPPALYQTLLARPDLRDHDLSSLRLAVTGAAVIPVDLVVRMRDELGFDTVITGYGLTEATGIATMCRFDDDPETIATTSGRAIPDVEVLVVDDAGAEVPRGRPGEVVVRGYNVMRGYYEDPEQTAAAIDDRGWLHTGDIGVMDERGYLRITDRKKDMFIVGGFNAYPAEIENVLLGYAGVAQVAVVGVPDERLGEVGMAFVVPRADADVDADALIAWSRERMANFKVPRRIEIVDALPLNATGKVLKYELRARVQDATS